MVPHLPGKVFPLFCEKPSNSAASSSLFLSLYIHIYSSVNLVTQEITAKFSAVRQPRDPGFGAVDLKYDQNLSECHVC